MIREMIDTLRERALALHHGQGGAVSMMCVAGIIIVFMVSLIIVDAGQVARDKVQVQVASDTAAYSQAAVKARTMNMVAFTNVAKRSIVGVYAIYHGAWQAYSAWYASRVAQCFKWLPNLSACKDVAKNFSTWFGEGLGDWRKFSGFPFVPLVFGGAVKSKYNKEMAQITKYQDYILKLTPWWAHFEASVRGNRNGTSITATYPPPKGLSSGVTGFIQTVTSVLKSLGLFTKTGKYDQMEKNLLKYHKGVSMCMAIAPWQMVMDLAFGAEMAANVAVMAAKSKKDAPRFAGAGLGSGWLNCMLTQLFGAFKSKDIGYWKVKNYNNRKERGNVIFSYRNNPNIRGMYSQNYEKISSYSQYSTWQNKALADHSAGVWAVAAGEIVQVGKKDQWHTNWTGRVRPVRATGDNNLNLSAAYHDVLPFIGVQTLVGLANNLDAGDALQDFVAFEKATRTMGTGTKNGLIK